MKRLATLAVLPLLVAGLIGFTGGRASAAGRTAAQPTSDKFCILFIICFTLPGSSSSSASPSPTAPATPAPTATPTGTPASAGATPGATGSPAPAASPAPTGTPSPSATTPDDATAASGLVVSNVTWTMNVSSASLTGFTYKGNVNLPVAGGGSVQMMEFTVSSMSMSNAVTRITENGETATETDAAFTASGVTMYATQLSGSLLGVPVTFTPSTLTIANLLKLPNAGELQLTNLLTSAVTLTMTNVTADQTVILTGQAQKTTVAVTQR